MSIKGSNKTVNIDPEVIGDVCIKINMSANSLSQLVEELRSVIYNQYGSRADSPLAGGKGELIQESAWALANKLDSFAMQLAYIRKDVNDGHIKAVEAQKDRTGISGTTSKIASIRNQHGVKG